MASFVCLLTFVLMVAKLFGVSCIGWGVVIAPAALYVVFWVGVLIVVLIDERRRHG